MKKIPYRRDSVQYDFANYLMITTLIISVILCFFYQEFYFILPVMVIPAIMVFAQNWVFDGQIEFIQKDGKWYLFDHQVGELQSHKIKKYQFSWHYSFLEMRNDHSGGRGTTHANYTNLLLSIELENGQKIAFVQNLWPWQVEPPGWRYALYIKEDYHKDLRLKISLSRLAKHLHP